MELGGYTPIADVGVQSPCNRRGSGKRIPRGLVLYAESKTEFICISFIKHIFELKGCICGSDIESAKFRFDNSELCFPRSCRVEKGSMIPYKGSINKWRFF